MVLCFLTQSTEEVHVLVTGWKAGVGLEMFQFGAGLLNDGSVTWLLSFFKDILH